MELRWGKLGKRVVVQFGRFEGVARRRRGDRDSIVMGLAVAIVKADEKTSVPDVPIPHFFQARDDLVSRIMAAREGYRSAMTAQRHKRVYNDLIFGITEWEPRTDFGNPVATVSESYLAELHARTIAPWLEHEHGHEIST